MEERAADYLSRNGYRVLERNYRTRFGEIDIVAFAGEVLAFVEVRYRKPASLVTAEESITREKRRRLKLAIRRYLGEREVSDRVPVRVDLCVVRDSGRSFEILAGIVEFP